MGDRESQFEGGFFDELLKPPPTEPEEDAESELGAYVRARRELIGAGLRQFARAIDCSPATMSRLENGDLTPGYELASKIAATLSVNGAPCDKDALLLMAGHTPKDCKPETPDECRAVRKALNILRGSKEG